MFIYLMFAIGHYVGDYVLQSRDIAHTKSKSIRSLFIHIMLYTYTLYFFLLAGVCLPNSSRPFVQHDMIPILTLYIALYNGAAHFMVDYVTSKMSMAAYKDNDLRKFWLIIGLDQMLHLMWFIVSLELFWGTNVL